MHTITYLPSWHVLDIEVSGFWTAEAFQVFAAHLAAAIASAPGPTPPASLYNYTRAAIQSREVIDLMQQLARQVSPARWVALYTEGRLARMQARRVSAICPTMEVFESRAAALDWLIGSADRQRVA